MREHIAIPDRRKVELRNYLRIARSVLSDKSLKSPNVTQAFYRSIRIEQFSGDIKAGVDEEMAFLKKLVLACAQRYKLKMPRIKVKYSWLEESAAAKIFMRSGVFYMEVDDKYCADDRRLTVIVAHEISHVVLGKKGILLEPTLRNEELTDAVAILAGFGWLFYKVCSTEEIIPAARGKEFNTVKHQKMGYLKREDIAFLLAIKETISADRTVVRWLPINLNDNLFCSACGAEIRAPGRQGVFRVACPICSVRHRVRFGTIYKGPSNIIRLVEVVILWPILRTRDRLCWFS